MKKKCINTKLKLITVTFLVPMALIVNSFGQGVPAGVGETNKNIIWLKASEGITLNGADVSGWTDQSSYGHEAAQATASQQPLFVADGGADFNNNPIIRFDGIDEYLTIPDNDNLDNTNELSIFFVAKPTNVTSGYPGMVSKLSSWTNDESYSFYVRQNQNFRFRVNDGNGISSSNTGTLSAGTNYIFTGIFNANASSSNLSTYYNSIASGTDNYTGAIPNNASDLYIGMRDISVDFFEGDVAEIIISTEAYNQAERIIIENYLSSKYGNAIGANDYFSEGNGSYNDDVIGIGTTDGNGSSHAASMNSSAGLYVADATNSLDAANEFLFIGHDNTVAHADGNVSDLPGTVVSRWEKDWYLDVTGTIDVGLSFDFGEALGTGPLNANYYVLLYRSGTSGPYSIVAEAFPDIIESDRIIFYAPAASINDGYYTIGKLTTLPTYTTIYALYSGNWSTAANWSFTEGAPDNPSNFTPDNDANYIVVINNGINITVDGNTKNNRKLDVKGNLFLGNTTGHFFDQITGSGKIEMENDNFPAYYNASGFIGSGGGTVDIKPTADLDLTVSKEYNNLRIYGGSNTVTLLADYNLNGFFEIHTGTLQFGDASTQVDVTVKDNFEIEVGGTLLSGNTQIHSLTVQGDVNIDGIGNFTNQTTYNYSSAPTQGAIDLIFNNTTANQALNCYNSAKFYRIQIHKGSIDKVLTIYASDPSYFYLYGRNNQSYGTDYNPSGTQNEKALALNSGSVKLTSNINIPSLSSSYTDWFWGTVGTWYPINTNAQLWLDGATVTIDGSGLGLPNYTYLAIYGKLLVSNTNSVLNVIGDGISGILARNEGSLEIQNGTINTVTFRTSAWGGLGDNIGSYTQSGGTVNITGTSLAVPDDIYFKFHIPFTTNGFIMSGGILNIDEPREGSDDGTNGGLLINCADGNYNVTGGTVNLTLNTARDFRLNSTAPLYNLNLEKTIAGDAYDFIIDDYVATSGEAPSVDAQPLTILNNLTIVESGFNTEFNPDGIDVKIGRQFTIEDGAIYTPGTNTTTFFTGPAQRIAGDTTARSRLIIENTSTAAPITFNNLNLELDNIGYLDSTTTEIISTGRTTTLDAVNNYVLTVNGNLTVAASNTFDYNNLSINLKGNLINKGIIGKKGNITRFNSTTANQTISSSVTNGILALVEIDNSFGATLKDNDEFDLRLTTGILDIGTHKFTTDGGIQISSGAPGTRTDFNNTLMILTAGLNSDGGYIRRFMDGSTNGTYVYPVGTYNGTANIYTPAEVIIPSGVTVNGDDNYLGVVPVDTYHPGTKSGDENKVLHYYWKTDSIGFSSITGTASINYKFYGVSSIPNSNNNYKSQLLLNNNWIDDNNNSYDKTNVLLTFTDNGSATFGFERADFTCGNASVFTALTVLYSRNATSGGDWETLSTWSNTGHDGDLATGANKIPGANVFVVIADGHTVTIASNTMASSDITLQGTLDIAATTGHTFANISGNGTFRMSGNTLPTAGFASFTEVNNSTFEYYGTDPTIAAYTLPATLTTYYNLHLDGTTIKTLPLADLTIRNNLKIKSNSTQVYLNDGASGDLTIEDSLIIDGSSDLIFPNSGARNLILSNDVVLNDNGASMMVEAVSGADITHSITTTAGLKALDAGAAFDFFSTDGTYENLVNVVLTGSTDADIGESGYALGELHNLVINKGTSQSAKVNFYNAYLLGETDGALSALEIQNGTITIINDLAPFTTTPLVLSSGGDDFNIPTTGALIINTGRCTVTGANTGISLNGKLRIEGSGELWLDDGSNNNYIEYGVTPTLEIVDNADVIIGSQLRQPTGTDANSLNFIQTGGTLVVGKNSVPTTTKSVFEIKNSGNFTFTGGNLTIVQGHSGSDFYLESGISSNCTGTINIGNGDSPAGTIDIYSGIALNNLTLAGSSVTCELASAIDLNGDLTIGNSTTLSSSASNWNLNIAGNFSNSGTYTPGTNTTTFDGIIQDFTGATTFNNLTISSSTSLTLDNTSNLVVNSHFNNASTFDNGGSNIDVKGDLTNSGTISGSGTINLIGTGLQTVNSGTFSNITIDNPSVAGVILAGDVTITGDFTLTNGILNLQAHELYLQNNPVINGSSFSANKMITTAGDISNKGLKIGIPAGAGTYSIPIGAGVKYSEIDFIVNSTTSTSGTITITPVNSYHPTATVTDSVLQFYWALTSTGLTDLNADLTFNYNASDVLGDETKYQLCWLVGTNWYKDPDLVDNINHKAEFTGTLSVDGEYTAGDPNAIPDNVPIYTSTGTSDWTSHLSWTGTPALTAGQYPKGAVVIIQAGDAITLDINGIKSYKTQIDGELIVNGTIAHNIGYVEGSGKLTVTNVGSLPSGNLNIFTSASGGTVDFSGATPYTISGVYTNFNNLTLSGSGLREFPSGPISIKNNLSIEGTTTLDNTASNGRIIIQGDMNIASGATFSAGTNNAIVEFAGTSIQNIGGTGDFTGPNKFHKLEINNSSGLNINKNTTVNDEIVFTDGLIENTENFSLTLNNAATYSGISNASFVNGPVQRTIDDNGSGTFPTGLTNQFKEIGVVNVTEPTTWIAEFTGTNADLTISSNDSELVKVSAIDTWSLESPIANTAEVTLYWNSSSGVGTAADLPNLRVAWWDANPTAGWLSQGQGSRTGDENSGSITASTATSFSPQLFALASTAEVPLPVEMLYFTGISNTDNVELSWGTATETFNDYFEIQRSIDAKTFVTIGKVYGAGNSMVHLDYKFIDENPNNGTSYYRLRQVDYDGTSVDHNSIAVTWQGKEENLDSDDILIYPNPYSSGDLILDLHRLEPYTSINLAIMNVSGKLIYKAGLIIPEDQRVNLIPLAIDKLPQGIYVVSVQTANKVLNKKVIIN